MSLPPHLEALRDEALQTSCDAWARRKRWRLGPGVDRAGPCPMCGGTDRFAVHTRKDTFLCRRCGITGSGVIKLVMQTEGVEFTQACEIITGRSAEAPVDPDHARNLAEQAERERQRQAASQDRYRQKARRDGFDIWNAASRSPWVAGNPVADYLAVRGIDLAAVHARAPNALASIRQRDALSWREKQGRDWVTLATTPAMVAAVQRPDGTFGAAHITWLDSAQPKGKLVLPDREDGKSRPSKKVRGTKKGGAIRLFTPGDRPRRIVMGEGIETTASVLAHAFEPDTAYWAGVDLGNMAGRAARDSNGKPIHDQPDMDDDEAFVPPEWCEELVYLSDGDDSESRIIEKLTRGLRRAKRCRPGLRGLLVPPPAEGQDWNDIAMAMARQEDVGA